MIVEKSHFEFLISSHHLKLVLREILKLEFRVRPTREKISVWLTEWISNEKLADKK